MRASVLLRASGKIETGVMRSVLRVCVCVLLLLFFFVVVFSMRRAAVLYATKAMDRGRRQARRERTAVVKA